MKLVHYILTVEDKGKLIRVMHVCNTQAVYAVLSVTGLLAQEACIWNDQVEIFKRFVPLDQMLLMLKNARKGSWNSELFAQYKGRTNKTKQKICRSQNNSLKQAMKMMFIVQCAKHPERKSRKTNNSLGYAH